MKLFRRHSAVMLTELLIASMLIAILSSTMILNPSSARQPVNREAERLAAKLELATKNADRMSMGFKMHVSKDIIEFKYFAGTREDDFKYKEQYFFASEGCYFSTHDGDFYYNEESHPKFLHKRNPVIRISDSENGIYNIKIESQNTSCYVVISADI